jgi:hypothetical protein
MSPKFYWFLWVLFFASAGILWLGGVFTLTTLIVYGFVSFGLVFTGMMCVLPNVVSQPVQKRVAKPRKVKQAAPKPTPVPANAVPATAKRALA